MLTSAPAGQVSIRTLRQCPLLTSICKRRVTSKWGSGERAKVCIVRGPVHLSVMRGEDRSLRLRVTRRDEPDLAKLIEWVLGIAEARHRAWVNGEPDPFGLPPPDDLASARR